MLGAQDVYALRMDVDTRHLRAFVAVVDEGTFTDAAIALRLSQASVSRSVQRLESAVGAHLLARNARHVTLTATGEQVLRHARRVLVELEQLRVAAIGDEEGLHLGYAWSTLGAHTTSVQRSWTREGLGDLELVHHDTSTAGLLEGRCEVAVLRWLPTDTRLDSVVVGQERRVAAVASDHRLADRGAVVLADLAAETVAVGTGPSTTSAALWGVGPGPSRYRPTHGVDEWLTVIATGRAVGISAEATAAQHPRPGIAYLPVTDAPLIDVRLAWWRASPPLRLDRLVDLVRASYAC